MNRPIALVAALAAALLLAGAPAHADEPPSYRQFEVKSKSGRYLAEVRHDGKSARTDPKAWTVTVYDQGADGKQKQKLWAAKYPYRGYPGGLLTDDGKAFVYVEFWYYPKHPVVLVYRDGKELAAINGEAMKIDPSKLPKTASHQLWLTDEGTSTLRKAGDKWHVDLPCRDGKKRSVDLQTGALSGV